MKKDFPFPWTTATIQLATGLIYSIPLWFLKVRKLPVLSKDDLFRLLPIAMLNTLGHACAVIA